MVRNFFTEFKVINITNFAANLRDDLADSDSSSSSVLYALDGDK